MSFVTGLRPTFLLTTTGGKEKYFPASEHIMRNFLEHVLPFRVCFKEDAPFGRHRRRLPPLPRLVGLPVTPTEPRRCSGASTLSKSTYITFQSPISHPILQVVVSPPKYQAGFGSYPTENPEDIPSNEVGLPPRRGRRLPSGGILCLATN